MDMWRGLFCRDGEVSYNFAGGEGDRRGGAFTAFPIMPMQAMEGVVAIYVVGCGAGAVRFGLVVRREAEAEGLGVFGDG